MENQTTAPVMDVTAPPPKPPTTNSEEVATAPPYEDSEYIETDMPDDKKQELIKEIKANETAASKTDTKEDPKEDKKQKAVTQQKSKNPSSNVGLAIIATVVIVFGLAAIATYAYFQQTS